jgi:transketolase
MIGAATGLAKEGFLPYCYSIGTFAAFRPYEFIRNGPVHHNVPVRIVGTGREREYGHAGFSHWPEGDTVALQQIGLAAWIPKDDTWLRRNFTFYHNLPFPLYISLSRFDTP